jgi:hypothetical protein
LNGPIKRTLIFKGERALDIPQLDGKFSGFDLDVLEVLIGLRGSVASLLGIGGDVFDGSSGLLGITFCMPSSERSSGRALSKRAFISSTVSSLEKP